MTKHCTLVRRFGLDSTCEGRLTRSTRHRAAAHLSDSAVVDVHSEFTCLKCGQHVVLKEELICGKSSTNPNPDPSEPTTP